MKTWLLILWTATVIAAAIVLFVLPAAAQQQPCGPIQEFLKQLEAKFKEFVVMEGDAGAGGRVIVTRADDGSWSVLAVREENIGCLMASGKHSHFDVGF